MSLKSRKVILLREFKYSLKKFNDQPFFICGIQSKVYLKRPYKMTLFEQESQKIKLVKI